MAIYLDYAATTPVCPQAAQAALEVMTQGFGNPSSQYASGQAAAQRLASDRMVVAQALGCQPEELFFISCGTEGDNWALRSAAALGRRRGKHLIVTAIEHSAVLETAKAMEREGFSVSYLKPDRSGHIRLDDLRSALREDTVLVSMMLVNNELGTRQPVEEAVRMVRSYSPHILFHTDAVQAFLKIPFTPAELGVDLLTVSGHKVYAPKGIGAQYIRKNLKLPPLLTGGGQEGGLRPGTEPTAQIAALAAACQAWDPAWPEQMTQCKTYALQALSSVPGLEIISSGDAPHICAVALPGYPSEMVVRELSGQGIYLSSGSACHRGKPSHVFAALGLPKRTLLGALRLSFSPQTTRQEVDTLVQALIQITRTRVAMR